jgi:hypothetical protein
MAKKSVGKKLPVKKPVRSSISALDDAVVTDELAVHTRAAKRRKEEVDKKVAAYTFDQPTNLVNAKQVAEPFVNKHEGDGKPRTIHRFPYFFKLTYYKENGKFYTSDVVLWEVSPIIDQLETAYLYDAVAKLRGLIQHASDQNPLPGLVGGWDGFVTIEQVFPKMESAPARDTLLDLSFGPKHRTISHLNPDHFVGNHCTPHLLVCTRMVADYAAPPKMTHEEIQAALTPEKIEEFVASPKKRKHNSSKTRP